MKQVKSEDHFLLRSSCIGKNITNANFLSFFLFSLFAVSSFFSGYLIASIILIVFGIFALFWNLDVAKTIMAITKWVALGAIVGYTLGLVTGYFFGLPIIGNSIGLCASLEIIRRTID